MKNIMLIQQMKGHAAIDALSVEHSDLEISHFMKIKQFANFEAADGHFTAADQCKWVRTPPEYPNLY